eukprot:750319-Hanusia_phi.AAC.2
MKCGCALSTSARHGVTQGSVGHARPHLPSRRRLSDSVGKLDLPTQCREREARLILVGTP